MKKINVFICFTFLAFFVFVNNNVYAKDLISTIDIADSVTNRDITKEVEHVRGFGDAKWPWDVPNEEYTSYNHVTYSLNLEKNKTFDNWFRFRIHNRSGDSQDLLLSINNHFLALVDVYTKNSHGALEKVWRTGLERGLTSKPYPSGVFSFPLHINNHDSVIVYVKIRSDFNAQLNFNLQNVGVYSKNEALDKIANGVMTGVVGLACLYSLIMFIFMREFRFFNYTLLTCSMTLNLLLTGSYMSLFSAFSFEIDIIKLFIFSNYMLLLGLLLSASEYLTVIIKNLTKLINVVFSVCLVCGAIATWFVPTYYTLLFIISCFVVKIITSSIVLFFCIHKRNMVKIAYLIAIITFLVGGLIPCLSTIGVLNGDVYTRMGFFVVTIPICFVITISIAHRIYQEKHSNIRINRKANLSKKKYIQFFKLSNEGMFTANEDGDIKSGNPALCKLLGFEEYTELTDVGITSVQEFCVDDKDYDLLISDLFELQDKLRESGQLKDLEKIVASRNIKILNKDKQEILVTMSIRMHEDFDGMYNIIGEVTDLSTNEDFKKKLDYLTYHDELTGVYNRKFMISELLRIFNKKTDDDNVKNDYFCLINISNYKYINEQVTHNESDDFIKQIANVMNNHMTKKSSLIRLSFEEFAFIIEDAYSTDVTSLARTLRTEISKLKFVSGNDIYTIASNFGIVNIKIADANISTLLSCADAVCRKACSNGSNQILNWVEGKQELFSIVVNRNIKTVSRIVRAIEENSSDIYVTKQKIDGVGDKSSGRTPFYEYGVAVRTGDNVDANFKDLLSVIEGFNVIIRVEKWLIKNVANLYTGDNVKNLNSVGKIFINLHFESICDFDFREELFDYLQENQEFASKLCIKIKEEYVKNRMDIVSLYVNKFRTLGVEFLLDDYQGIGSVSILHMLKFSFVKLDSSLTKAVEDEQITQVVINSIIKLLVAFNAKICVSDVDTPREYKYLTDLAIDYCQGIFISANEKVALKPLSRDLQHKFL